MKKFLFVTLLPLLVLANEIIPGNVLTLDVKDQYDTPYSILDDSKYVLIATSKENGKMINAFLEEKGHQILSDKKVRYYSDVSQVPSFVMSLFMLPKFEDYPFKMGLIRDDELAKTLPKQEEKITLIKINNKTIQAIQYLENTDTLMQSLQ